MEYKELTQSELDAYDDQEIVVWTNAASEKEICKKPHCEIFAYARRKVDEFRLLDKKPIYTSGEIKSARMMARDILLTSLM